MYCALVMHGVQSVYAGWNHFHRYTILFLSTRSTILSQPRIWWQQRIERQKVWKKKSYSWDGAWRYVSFVILVYIFSVQIQYIFTVCTGCYGSGSSVPTKFLFENWLSTIAYFMYIVICIARWWVRSPLRLLLLRSTWASCSLFSSIIKMSFTGCLADRTLYIHWGEIFKIRNGEAHTEKSCYKNMIHITRWMCIINVCLLIRCTVHHTTAFR